MRRCPARGRLLIALLASAAALALAAAAVGTGVHRYASYVEIESFSARAPNTAQEFSLDGGVGSNRRSCRFRRRVQVHVISDGVDSVVATDRTRLVPPEEVEGFYSATFTTPDHGFTLYTKVTRRQRHGVICRRASSSRKHYAS